MCSRHSWRRHRLFNRPQYHQTIKLNPHSNPMNSAKVSTKCLGHCRAQEGALRASVYELQKASIKAYEQGKEHVFHGHCWARHIVPKEAAEAASNSREVYEDEVDHNTCLGHIRAQEIAVREDAAKAAYELEKASIKAYEDGVDSWDGPIWPWKGAHLTAEAEEKYDNNYTPPELNDRSPVSG